MMWIPQRACFVVAAMRHGRRKRSTASRRNCVWHQVGMTKADLQNLPDSQIKIVEPRRTRHETRSKVETLIIAPNTRSNSTIT